MVNKQWSLSAPSQEKIQTLLTTISAGKIPHTRLSIPVIFLSSFLKKMAKDEDDSLVIHKTRSTLYT